MDTTYTIAVIATVVVILAVGIFWHTHLSHSMMPSKLVGKLDITLADNYSPNAEVGGTYAVVSVVDFSGNAVVRYIEVNFDRMAFRKLRSLASDNAYIFADAVHSLILKKKGVTYMHTRINGKRVTGSDLYEHHLTPAVKMA